MREWDTERENRLSSLSRRTVWLALLAIVFLAAVLRMGWPGLTEFKADEARMVSLALDMIEGRRLATRGMVSSVGVPNTPISVWLYALPLMVWRHVYSATLFTGLLNTLAVLGCAWFVRRYWGNAAALTATLMYAASPWAIFYSRKIWAQNLLPALVMAWAISAALALIERRPRFIVGHLLSLALVVQVHFSGLALLPATTILLLIFRQRVNWRLALLGAALAALTVLPYAYDLLCTGLAPSTFLQALGGSPSRVDLASLRDTWLLTLGREIHSLAGAEAFRDYLATVPDISLVHGLWGVLIVAGLAWLARQAWRDRRDPTAQAGLLVLIWALAPPLFFLWHSTPVYPHYFITVYPAPYIAAGVAFALLVRRVRWAGWAALLANCAAQVWVWVALLAFVGTRATPGAFGTPLAIQLQAADAARRLVDEGSAAEVLIAGPGSLGQGDAFALVNTVLLRSVPSRVVNANRSALFPATPSAVLLSQPAAEAAELYLGAATRMVRVPLRAGEGALQVLLVPRGAAPVAESEFDPPYRLANGVQLLGYDAPILRDDGAAQWQIYWRVGSPSAADYHFFNHLLDGQGNRISQADAAAFPAQQWQPGDTVISRFVLPWLDGAAGPLTMRTGMYTYLDIQSVPVLDLAGNPYADAVEILLDSAGG